VSGSQVYHYFEDKQALVRAVIEYQTDSVLDTQGEHLDNLDTMPGLRAWRDLLVGHQRRLQCRGGCPIGALGAEVAETDDNACMAVARGFHRWEVRIRAGLRAMHARGELPAATDPDDLALAPDRLLCPDPVRYMSVIMGTAEHTTAYCGGLRRRPERVADTVRWLLLSVQRGINELSTDQSGRPRRRVGTRRRHNRPARAGGLQTAPSSKGGRVGTRFRIAALTCWYYG
jgi:AcrR family transcriptional regulator